MSEIEIVKPMDIERRSFEIITERLQGRSFGPELDDIVKRVIHTSADFEYADQLVFSEGVVEKALAAIKAGATIVTDTQMAWSGINKKILESFGGAAVCFMSDEDVAKEAKAREITRAMVSMEKAATLEGPVIFAIGNAPTALIRIHELVQEKKLSPAMVIGVPVGFVNVVEAKELIIQSGIPHIVARGNKGGSNIAAAICNALLYKLRR
ncbi:MAG: precorrin-8X methylmutase [Lachnospiraceae bacterium]|nr:precorrin-8X methylmutase [Lachnospiraceae bacterium]